MYRLMRRATGSIYTSEIKVLLNLPSIILVLMYVNVKTLIMLMLFLEQTHGRPGARGHHVGDPCTRVSQAAVGTFNDPQSPVCWPDT